MSNPYHHALSSVKKWGGCVEDYIEIHSWFDGSKAHYADPRHRALRHHTLGIFECEEKFGKYITNSSEKMIPVRWIGEQHVIEDCGFIPSLQDWFSCIQLQRWMDKPMKLSKDLEKNNVEITAS